MGDLTRKRVIHVEGTIGAGKSEILRLLSSLEDVTVVPEPVENWTYFRGINGLQLLYSDPKRNAYAFQNLVFSTLARRSVPFTRRLTVFERSIQSSFHCFGKQLRNQGLLSELEFGALDELKNLLQSRIVGGLDVIIYLNVRPEVALDRIMQRNRPEEVEVRLPFLTELGQLYDEWIGNLVSAGKEVYIVDANRPIMEVGNECFAVLERLGKGASTSTLTPPQDWNPANGGPIGFNQFNLTDIEDCCSTTKQQ